MGEKKKGNKHYLWGKHRSGETKRKISEARKGMHISEETKIKISLATRLENNPRWRGGLSFEPHSPTFNNQLKKGIRERDKNQCQLCGTKQNGREFPIHHINYNKHDDRPINLITLCDPHHSQANSNRHKWQLFFEIYQELRDSNV